MRTETESSTSIEHTPYFDTLIQQLGLTIRNDYRRGQHRVLRRKPVSQQFTVEAFGWATRSIRELYYAQAAMKRSIGQELAGYNIRVQSIKVKIHVIDILQKKFRAHVTVRPLY